MWTAEKIAALPVAARFSSETQVIDGKTYMVPVVNDFRIVFVQDNEPDKYRDSNGDRWKLVLRPDGEYVRTRMMGSF